MVPPPGGWDLAFVLRFIENTGTNWVRFVFFLEFDLVSSVRAPLIPGVSHTGVSIAPRRREFGDRNAFRLVFSTQAGWFKLRQRPAKLKR